MRGVAAMLVVSVHGIAALGHAATPIRGAFLPAVPNATVFGACGVDLFFVISGFVMAHGLGGVHDAGTFLRRRAIRIVPLFVIMSLAALAAGLHKDPVTAETLVSTLLIVPWIDTTGYHAPALVVGWTLAFEFAFYALVAIVIRHGRARVTILLTLTLAAGLAGMAVSPPWAPLRLVLNPMQFEFACGIALWIGWSQGWTRRFGRPAFVAGALALLLGLAGAIPISVQTDYWLVVDGTSSLARAVVWGLPFALLLAGMIDAGGWESAPAAAMRVIGDASYSIYLTHCFVLEILQTLRVGPVDAYLFMATAMAASLAVGIAVHRLVERPLLAVLHRPARSRPAAIVPA